MPLLGLILAFLLALPAPPPRAAEIVAALDGPVLVLGDGARVRLAGIETSSSPAMPKTLKELVFEQRVEVETTGQDRLGRLIAHVRRPDGLWLQGELLRRGLARVRTARDDRALATEMLALEAEARQAGRGLWTHPQWTVRTPQTVLRFLDSFQIVEGRVLSAKRVRQQVFLNFGPDYKTDFTARIAAPTLKLWREAGRDPLALEGAAVRVRGWVRSWDGPLIDVTHPEQVERLP